MNKQNIAATVTSLSAGLGIILLAQNNVKAQTFADAWIQNTDGGTRDTESEEPVLDPEYSNTNPDPEVNPDSEVLANGDAPVDAPAAGLGTRFSAFLRGDQELVRGGFNSRFNLYDFNDDISLRGSLAAEMFEFNPYEITVQTPFGELTDTTFKRGEGFYGQGLIGLGFNLNDNMLLQTLTGYTHLELGATIHDTRATPVFTSGLMFNVGKMIDDYNLSVRGLYSIGESADYHALDTALDLNLKIADEWSAFFNGGVSWSELRGDNEQINLDWMAGVGYQGDVIGGKLGLTYQYGWARVLDQFKTVLDGSGRFGTIPGQDMRVEDLFGVGGEFVLRPFEDKNWELVFGTSLPLFGSGPGTDGEYDLTPGFSWNLGIRYNGNGNSSTGNSRAPYFPRTTGTSDRYGGETHRDGAQ
jgi:hypothetical protein